MSLFFNELDFILLASFDTNVAHCDVKESIKKPMIKNMEQSERNKKYWQQNIRYLIILLTVWFICSFGFGILWVDTLDQIRIGGFGLGFWFAQQGSIYSFVIIIFVYVYLMNRLDHKYEAHHSSKDQNKD